MKLLSYKVRVVLSGFIILGISAWGFVQFSSNNPSKYTKVAKNLDSLITQSETVSLQAKTYKNVFLDSLKNGLLVDSDSARIRKKLELIAIKFFHDFRFGTQKPSLRFEGFKFDLKESVFKNKVNLAVSKGDLSDLFRQINETESKEVQTLLQVKRDSTHWKISQKNLIDKAIQEFRWLHQVKRYYPLVLINIPATELKYFEKGEVKLAMKTVVGRPEKPSKTLSSRIKTMIMFPLWEVPRSISVEELVPEIQKRIRYFHASHLLIYNRNNERVTPESVPWHRLNANYFPYRMVQRTGYWNTLGLLKFLFDNPFKMYLHDTSEKKLFAKEKRFYSHSCIRLEKPLELGKLFLNGNSIALDTLNPNTKQVDVSPIYLPVKRTIPLIIWYSLVDFNDKGDVRFLENVYGRE